MPEPEFKTFIGRYQYRGAQWGFEVVAADREDARQRVLQMAQSGELDGELVMKLPAYTGPLAGIIAAVRNAFAKGGAP